MEHKEDLNIWELRRSYTKGGLQEAEVPQEPFILLRQWVQQAVTSDALEPNAISLATVKQDGTPDVRMVLLKEIEEGAIVFFTNYGSEKASDLSEHPVAACGIWWPELERQVRLKGVVEKVSRQESSAYFANRPRESRLGAWASEQSREIKDRKELENRFEKARRRFEGKDIPVPEQWGGFRIHVSRIEFWQGRTGRMHDRILYVKTRSSWDRKRLSP